MADFGDRAIRLRHFFWAKHDQDLARKQSFQGFSVTFFFGLLKSQHSSGKGVKKWSFWSLRPHPLKSQHTSGNGVQNVEKTCSKSTVFNLERGVFHVRRFCPFLMVNPDAMIAFQGPNFWGGVLDDLGQLDEGCLILDLLFEASAY